MDLTKITVSDLISDTHPLPEDAEWLRSQPSPAAVWDGCTNPKWLLWLLYQIETPRPLCINLAADMAGHVLSIYETKYPNDKRPRTAVALARACANADPDGNADTRAAFNAASHAANAAAEDALYASHACVFDIGTRAAYYAARAAANVAYAATHPGSGYLADVATYSYAADAAVIADDERRWQCRRIREVIGNRFRTGPDQP
jgi:hypothetical protein